VKWLSSILLTAVFIRHYGYGWLSEFWGTSRGVAFLILGGWLEIVLAAVLLWLMWKAALPVVRAALVILISEASQVMVCRMAVPDVSAKPDTMNTCDYWTGLPITSVFAALYLFILCYSIMRWKNAH
jgi:uncharacterized membrane protein